MIIQNSTAKTVDFGKIAVNITNGIMIAVFLAAGGENLIKNEFHKQRDLR